MWRLLHLAALGALIGSAVYVYSLKYQTIFAAEQIVKLKHQVNRETDAINMLRAEYAHIVRPDRVQSLADRLIETQPLALNQIVKPEDIPEKATEDSIGRKLETLGLMNLTASPANGVVGATPAQR